MKNMLQKKYTVIIGDLIRSRYKSDRQRVSDKIRSIVTTLSNTYQSELQAPLTVRGIDEFWCVLKHPARAYQLCRQLNDEIYPHVFRFIIIHDVVDVGTSLKDVTKMDGPAFHNAVDLLNIAKNEKRLIYFSLDRESKLFDRWLNELGQLIQVLRQGWTQRQRQVIRLYESEKKQKTIAKKLNITQQGVSDALSQAHWHDIKHAEDLLNDFLKNF